MLWRMVRRARPGVGEAGPSRPPRRHPSSGGRTWPPRALAGQEGTGPRGGTGWGCGTGAGCGHGTVEPSGYACGRTAGWMVAVKRTLRRTSQCTRARCPMPPLADAPGGLKADQNLPARICTPSSCSRTYHWDGDARFRPAAGMTPSFSARQGSSPRHGPSMRSRLRAGEDSNRHRTDCCPQEAGLILGSKRRSGVRASSSGCCDSAGCEMTLDGHGPMRTPEKIAIPTGLNLRNMPPPPLDTLHP